MLQPLAGSEATMCTNIAAALRSPVAETVFVLLTAFQTDLDIELSIPPTPRKVLHVVHGVKASAYHPLTTHLRRRSGLLNLDILGVKLLSLCY